MKIVSVSPARRGCHQELVAVVRALFLARKLRPGRRRLRFSTQLTGDRTATERSSGMLCRSMGSGVLELEAEDRVAVAAEKHQQTTRQKLREVYNRIRHEYEQFTSHKRSSLWCLRNWTERHESRRIDNQLRGRAGRQSDPGSTRLQLGITCYGFFGDRVAGLMNAFRVEEDAN